IIHKGGSWFSYGDQRLGQGRDNVKAMIKNDPDFAAELEAKIKEKMKEIQETSNQKYRPKAAPMAKTDADEAGAPAPKTTRAAARAKLDIAVEDDED
nr:DNA recombination/repair protein RecA [Eubacterium sp.]